MARAEWDKQAVFPATYESTEVSPTAWEGITVSPANWNPGNQPTPNYVLELSSGALLELSDGNILGLYVQ